MVTRQAYMEGTATHEQYYAQFVNERTIAHVVRSIGRDRLLASRDRHFNDIQLRHWDALAGGLPIAANFRDAGDCPTLAGLVCVAKQAARVYVERHNSAR